MAEEREINITTKQAIKILKRMEVKYDAGFGISWETIEYHLDELEE